MCAAWWHVRRSCMYCECLEHLPSFSTRVPVQSLITANHRRTLTRILSPNSMWKTPAHLMWMGFEPTTFDDNLTIRILPLLANFTALNFRQWNLSGFSNPVKIISCCQHFQIPHSLQHFWLETLQVRNYCAERARRNQEVTFSINFDSVMIIALHKCILKNINSWCWENDRQIILWIIQKFPRIFFFTNNLAIMSG